MNVAVNKKSIAKNYTFMAIMLACMAAGAIVGAKCPIALISRSASYEEKYYSLLLCALIS